MPRPSWLTPCGRRPAASPCSWWTGHRGSCWPPEVLQGILVGLGVLVALVLGSTVARRDVVLVFGDPLSRLVMLAVGLELVVLTWGRVYARAWRELRARLR